MKKGKASLILVIFLAAAIAVCGFGVFVLQETNNEGKMGLSLGLDLAGGVSITYQAEGDPSTEDMEDTIFKLQQRIEDETGSTEVSVYQVGDDRISVEIPGVTDANEILEQLGEPGTLEIQDSEGNVIISGEDIASAEAQATQGDTGNTEYVVALVLTDEGAETFAEFTSEHVNESMPIYYDGEMISNPTIKEAITGGECVIDGMESYEAAEELASYIRIGSLSVTLTELQSEVVSAQLGTDALSTAIIAAGIGLIIVMILMMAVYWVPGIVASLALVFYTGLVISCMYLFNITLTLPGIAGVILSIGMAVDANVIIYARIREELATDKAVKTAIDIGFVKARSAILDGNVTTFIAAVVLMAMGTGTVKGFAYTLAIGIVLSMFTALFVSHWLMRAVYALGCRDIKFYGKKKEQKTVAFLKRKPVFFLISLAVIVAGFVAMGVHSSQGDRALQYSLEFVGGTSTQADFGKDYTIEEIEDTIVPVVSEVTGDNDITTQKVQDSTEIIIKTRELDLEEREALAAALNENFGIDEDGITTESISSTISSEMRTNTIQAIVVAVILMLIYIWIRFKDLRFGSAAVLALIHDVLVVLTFYAIARLTVSTTFIACMLTIVGYSINATIVIFDRIRENNHGLRTKEELEEMVNTSITQTLTRSIYTSLTTFIMVAVMYGLCVESIKLFALPLMVGILCGAYSSVCITGALWYVFKTRIGKKRVQ
ncbi:MAG: protein translocase subunit SecD [Lachnospiraceae bacterium]|nr:protein translocase subunit SecD [Lachnospiraceae bacterium]